MKTMSSWAIGAFLIAVTTMSTLAPTAAASAVAHAQNAPATTTGDYEAARLQRVQSLNDPMIRGEVPTYYTPGYERHARSLQTLLTGEREFYKKELGVDVPFSLAVLDAKQWGAIEKETPFGMPNVDGKPVVAMIPANWAEVPWLITKESAADPALVQATKKHVADWMDAQAQTFDTIGGHELGHALENACGIVPGTRWLNEFLANYFLYAYVDSQRRDLLWTVPVLQATNHLDRPQHHVSLNDFESSYEHLMDKDPENYGWYQGRFIEQVQKVHAQQGIGFLKKVRAAFPSGPERFTLGNAETLRRLDRISPGFISWAHSLESFSQTPPQKAPVRPVTDDYFGTKVVDNYRWMENLKDPEMQRWMKSQADYTRATLDALPGYPALLKRIAELDNSPPAEVSDLQIIAGHYYTLRTPSGAQSARLYVRDGVNGKDRLLIDPEKLGANAKTHYSIHAYTPSPNGHYVAYLLAAGGSEESVLHVLNVQSRKDLPETADRIDGDIAAPFWRADSRSFFYARDQRSAPGMNATERKKNKRVYLHVLGHSFNDDPPILGRGVSDATIAMTPVEVAEIVTTPGSHYAIAIVSPGTDPRLRVYAGRVDAIHDGKTAWRAIAASYDDQYIAGDNSDYPIIALTGDTLYWPSRKGAPRGEILKLDLAHADSKPEVVVAQGELPISAMYAGRDAIYWRLNDAGVNSVHRLRLARGAEPETLSMPYAANIADLSTDMQGEATMILASSWLRSPAYLDVDAKTGAAAITDLQPAGPYDYPGDLTVEEVKVKSWDGTLVPLSIVHKKGPKLDGRNPIMLMGYGAYGISVSPFYFPAMRSWYERGGAFAFAHVRGGGEYGEAWHQAGFQVTKANTWRDYIACAQYLVDHNYTSTRKLVGMAQSAGGILIGRAIEERPDLFGAAIIRVPLADTLRAETTANGPDDIPEFGSVKTEAGFKALYAMSPYANVKDGVQYPAVIVYAGANDQRVDPWIPAKFAARLQAAAASGKPVLLRVDYDAGHTGLDATRHQSELNAADMFSFALWQTGDPDFQPASAAHN